jgi:hypothetical protein
VKRALAFIALFLCSGLLFAFDTTDKPVAPDGTVAVVDFPVTQHMQNVGGSDGYGLCVYTSVTVAARWQNLDSMLTFRKFAEGRPGGSYPEKLEADLKTFAARNKITLPPYVQHTGGDDAFLDLCYATRRSPSITYAGLDGYYDSGVAHMVTGAHLDAKWGAICDNNRSGSWVWMTRPQLLNRWKGKKDDGKDILVHVSDGFRTYWVPVGGGWAFVWLGPPPPPKAPSVAESMEQPVPPRLVWERVVMEDRVYWFLYDKGVLAFVVDPEGKWHAATGPETWDIAPLASPPDGIPGPAEPEPTKCWDYGLDIHRIPQAHRYWLNGIECSRAKAFAAVADPGGLVDDSDRYHLSIVGERKALLQLFASGGPLDRFNRRVHLQVYSPTDWPAKDRLSSIVTLQEPAKIGGKIVGTSSDVKELGRILADVFDPPVPPKKPDQPMVPPIPDKPDLGPPVNPTPPSPLRAPGGPAWLKALIYGIAAWILMRVVLPRRG